MTHGLPRWFRLLFTLVMLVLCCVVVAHLLHQNSAQTLIADLEAKIETSGQRLAKQQKEYDEYTALLPQVEAELAEAAPLAQAAAARVDELKAQRKTLRAENEALAAELTALQAQAEAVGAAALADTESLSQQVDQAVSQLDAAIDALQE